MEIVWRRIKSRIPANDDHIKRNDGLYDQIRVHAFCLPSHMTPYYNELRATGSHGWHTGFCCVHMILVVGFVDKANGQRDSIQENTEDGIDGMIG